MRRDVKFHANHGGDPATGPELPSVAIRFGTALQRGRLAGELLGGQPAGRPRRLSMAEGFRTTRSATLHPLADRALADTKGRGDLALRPVLLLEVPGLQSQCITAKSVTPMRVGSGSGVCWRGRRYPSSRSSGSWPSIGSSMTISRMGAARPPIRTLRLTRTKPLPPRSFGLLMVGKWTLPWMVSSGGAWRKCTLV
jgi:hypothetical protein